MNSQRKSSSVCLLLRRLRFVLANIILIHVAFNELQTAHAIFNCLTPGMFPKMGKSGYMGLPHSGERANWYSQAQMGAYGSSAPYPMGYGQYPMKLRFQNKLRGSLFGNKKWSGNANFYRPGFGYGAMSMPSPFQLPSSGYSFGDQSAALIQNPVLPGANSYNNDGWSVPINMNPATYQQSQLNQYDNYASQPLLQPPKPPGPTTTVIDNYGSTKGGGSTSNKQQFGTTKKPRY